VREPQQVSQYTTPTPTEFAHLSTIVVGGPSLRWFNLTSAVVAVGAEDTSSADYICSVCTRRGTPFQQCHNATVALLALGSPPALVKAAKNGERLHVV
jgi:hypothetical protein